MLPTVFDCCLVQGKAINHCKLNKTHVVLCNCPMMITQNLLPKVNLQWKATQLMRRTSAAHAARVNLPRLYTGLTWERHNGTSCSYMLLNFAYCIWQIGAYTMPEPIEKLKWKKTHMVTSQANPKQSWQPACAQQELVVFGENIAASLWPYLAMLSIACFGEN